MVAGKDLCQDDRWQLGRPPQIISQRLQAFRSTQQDASGRRQCRDRCLMTMP
jgi:hypothetical protein